MSFLEPIRLGPYEGDARWWGDSLAIIKASSETTAGRITVIDNIACAGAAPPVHIHHNEGEGFYLIEGTMTIWVGGTAIDASPGSYVYGPPDVPHTFVVTSPVARYLFITEPAGFDRFVRAVSTPADKLTLPPAIPEHQEDPNTLATIAAEFGIEIIGPPGIPA